MMESETKFVERVVKFALRRLAGTVTGVETTESVAALTFDDGPHPEYTPRLLKVMERYQARGTFFMVGEQAQRYPETVRRVAESGHVIGNHTWDHPSFPRISSAERRRQLRQCAQATEPYGQRLFRPPYGHQSMASHWDAVRLGYRVITWNMVAQDWVEHEPEWMTEQLAKELKPGKIILLHDALYTVTEESCANRETVIEAVRLLLERFSGRYRFVTIPELLRAGRPPLSDWYQTGDTDWLNKLSVSGKGPARQYAAR